MRLLNTLPNTAVQNSVINPKNDVAKKPATFFLSRFAKAWSSTLKLVLGKTTPKNNQSQDALRGSIAHVHNAKFDNNAAISTESAYGVMGNDAYEKVYKFHTAAFSQGKAQDHINQYRKDLPMGTEDMEKFSDENYGLRNFKEIGQRQYKNGQSRKVVTLALQKELNQKRLLASKGSEYGSCAAFSAMWLSDIEHGKTILEQPEKRMNLLKFGAREAAIRQKIYSDDFSHEDFLHVKNNQGQTQAQANVLKFAGLDMVTEKNLGACITMTIILSDSSTLSNRVKAHNIRLFLVKPIEMENTGGTQQRYTVYQMVHFFFLIQMLVNSMSPQQKCVHLCQSLLLNTMIILSANKLSG